MVNERLELKKYFKFLGQDGRNPVVDIYLHYNLSEMNRQNQKRPCLVICPGGAYRMCSERESEPIALNFLPDGFNIFVITYSVAPNRFPTQLREVAAVIELIYKNADEWHCDTSKIAIMGFSAGGHLAAHYSTMYDCKEVREYFPESKGVNATVLCYPVITASEKNSHKGSFVNLLGYYPEDKEEQEYFSCECNVKENTPPAFIWHTAADAAVPVQNSIRYAEALADKKIPFEMHIYPFGAHGRATCDYQTNDDVTPEIGYAHNWIWQAKRWLKLTLGYN